MSVETGAPAVSRTVPTILAVMSATAQQATASTQMAAAVMMLMSAWQRMEGVTTHVRTLLDPSSASVAVDTAWMRTAAPASC